MRTADDQVGNQEMDPTGQGERGTNVAMMGDVTDGDFEERVLGSEIPVLVDFWAEWCVPCHMVSPWSRRSVVTRARRCRSPS